MITNEWSYDLSAGMKIANYDPTYSIGVDELNFSFVERLCRLEIEADRRPSWG